jgi:ribonucleotide monophosphatase NagD (HAD superfamily)
VLFLTNNSTKTPRQFVEKLACMGIAANDADIMTSSIATAKYLRGRMRGRGRGMEWEGAAATSLARRVCAQR